MYVNAFKWPFVILCFSLKIVHSIQLDSSQSVEIGLASNDDDDQQIQPIRNKNIPNYSCRNKEDDGYYEHEDSCHKYWHCLYVDTIFERAFERKCPIGTMFHPLLRSCEVSTMLTCMGWKKSIFGKDYIEQQQLHNNQKQQQKQQLEISDDPLIGAQPIDLNESTTKINSLKQMKSKTKRPSKPVIFKAFITTTTSSTTPSSSAIFTDDLIDSNEDYSFDTTLLETITSTTKRAILSIPLMNSKHFNIVKKVIPITTTTTTTMSTTTSTTRLITQMNSKSSKRFKTLRAKTTISTIVSTTKVTSNETVNRTPTIEERISLKLNYLSSNRLNKTQIFDEIESIKVLFDQQAKRNMTSLTTTTTTTTTITTPSSTSTSCTTTSTSTLTTGIEDDSDENEYDYGLKSNLLKNAQNNQDNLIPLIFIATTTPKQTSDYVYDDEDRDYELNKSNESLVDNKQLIVEHNSLKSSDLISDTYDPVEAAITSASTSPNRALIKLNWILILKLLFINFYFN